MKLLRELGKQAKKIVKEGTGYLDKAPESVIARRRLICRNCTNVFKSRSPWSGKMDDRCKVCMCFVPEKTMLASQSCPVGKWLETEPKEKN